MLDTAGIEHCYDITTLDIVMLLSQYTFKQWYLITMLDTGGVEYRYACSLINLQSVDLLSVHLFA